MYIYVYIFMYLPFLLCHLVPFPPGLRREGGREGRKKGRKNRRTLRVRTEES
jgi:hypothetical protein